MHRVLPAASLVIAIFAIGCGSPAAPAPPSLNLPVPVQNLTASRVGNTVHLAWTMPTRTTDRVVLKHPIAARICRAFANQPCAPITTVAFAPGGAAQYNDELPAELSQGRGPSAGLRGGVSQPRGQDCRKLEHCLQRSRRCSGGSDCRDCSVPAERSSVELATGSRACADILSHGATAADCTCANGEAAFPPFGAYSRPFADAAGADGRSRSWARGGCFRRI